MVLGKLDSHVQKNETGPLSYTIHKINSKGIKECKTEIINPLEKNIGSKQLDIGLGNYFFNLTTKAKINKWDDIMIKSFCIARKPSKGEK